MSAGVWLIEIGSCALSYAIVGAVLRFAVRNNLLDVPNERSSHIVATPRGGGIGIVITFEMAICAFWAIHLMPGRLCSALALSSLAIAIVGFLDDRHQLGAPIRFLVHVGAALFFVVITGGYSPEELLRWGIQGIFLASGFSVLAAVWSTNLFNFMDGIDGIAASEAVFISVSGGALVMIVGGDAGLTATLLCLAAASFGFLVWNWPPARIFMGDVGSGFLGFVICACFMAGTQSRALPIEVLPILGGVFFVDATTTLIRRMLQRDRWMAPHRTHAYQWLTRKSGSHQSVTIAVALVDVIWLMPWAFVTVRTPEHAPMYLIAALLPLVIISIVVGAGRRETAPAR